MRDTTIAAAEYHGILDRLQAIEAKLLTYERHGWAVRENGRWHLTPQGFLLSNRLIGELLEVQEESSLETLLPRLRQQDT